MEVKKIEDEVWGEYYSASVLIDGKEYSAIGQTEELAKKHLKDILKFRNRKTLDLL